MSNSPKPNSLHLNKFIGIQLVILLYQLSLFADKDFLLEIISDAQLFPISVWNFPEGQIKNEDVDKGSTKDMMSIFIYN